MTSRRRGALLGLLRGEALQVTRRDDEHEHHHLAREHRHHGHDDQHHGHDHHDGHDRLHRADPGHAGRRLPADQAYRRRDKSRILHRLKRIEGQVRGLQRMVEEDQYCVDVLVQLSAVRAALDQVGLILLEDHTRGCLTRAVREEDGEAALDELMGVLGRFIKR